MGRLTRLVLVLCLIAGAASAATAQPVPIAFGDAVAGEIAGEGERAEYAFEATRGQSVFVDRTASSNANGLNWRLSDAWGRTLASDFTALGDLGPVPLLGGSYTLTVTGEGAATGTFEFTLADATPSTTAVALGDVIDSAIDAPGGVRHFTFEGSAGQTLFVDETASSNYYYLNWRLVDPFGRELQAWTTDLRDLGPFPLTDGTYTLSVRSEWGGTGTFVATLALPVTGGGAFTVGEDVAGEIATPGQSDEWTFTASAGQRVVIDETASSNYYGLNWSLVSDAGRVIFARTTDLGDRGPFLLDAGVHTLTLVGEGHGVGTYAFRVAEVTDGSATITIGETVTGAIEIAGQRQVYTFTAAPGQVVTLDTRATSNAGGLDWLLVDALGREIVPRTANLNDVQRLPLEGGVYTLTILGEGGNIGTYEFLLGEVTDDVGAVTVGGAVSGALDVPGDTDTWAFSAAPGQIVSLDQTATSNAGGLNWTLTDAFGRPLQGRTTNLNDVGPFTLLGGDYTVTVVGESGAVGTYSFTLVGGGTGAFSPSGDPIALGDAVTGSIDAPGEQDRYQLTLAAPTRVYVDLTAGAASVKWTLYDPVGQPVFGPVDARYPDTQDRGPWTLAAGTYTVELYHATDGTAAYGFQVVAVTDGVGSFAVGDLVAGAIATPGAANTYTFTLAEPSPVFLDLLAGGTRLYWTLLDPAGGEVFARTRARYDTTENRGPWTLAAGTYTLVLDPDYGDAPAYQFQLGSVGDEAFAAAVGDVVSGTFTEPGERHTVTFDVAAGERVYLDLQAGDVSLYWTLEDALGDTVFSNVQARYPASHDQGPFILPAGTTTLTIDPSHDDLPSYAFQILAVSDTEATFAVGDVVSGSIATPGARHGYTFTLTAPTRLYFDNQLGALNTYWTLESDNGERIFADASLRYVDGRGDLGPYTLAAGDYRIEIWSTELPSYQFQLVPVVDTAGTLPPSTVVPGAIGSVGGTATFTFEVTEDGRTVVLDLIESGAGLLWSAWDEVGAPLFEAQPAADVTFDDQGPFPLAAGTYTVVFDGDADAAPAFALQAFQYVPPEPGNCAEGAEPTPERCDGVDNDCDGLVDEEDYGNWDLYQAGAFLGPVTTLETFETVQVFYSYGLGFGSSYNGATLPPVSDESLIFVHRNLLDDELSFVIVHDQPNNPDGGRANFEVRNMGLRAHVAQADDPGEVGDSDFDGFGNAYFQWGWSTCCTDGIAIADLDWTNCITVVPDFVAGITAWNYLTDDVFDPRRIPLNMTEALSVCPSTCAACPPPDAAGGQVPTPVELSPDPNEVIAVSAAGTASVVLSGRIPAFPTRPIGGVIVNGAPAQVDATGRFWAAVTVVAGDNPFTIEVVERCGVSETNVVLTGATADEAATLTDISTRLAADYRDTTWNEELGRLFVDVRARANGDDAAVGAALMVFGPQLDPTITLEYPDGTIGWDAGADEGGAVQPYLALLGEGVTLAPGASADWRALSFLDPDRIPVRYDVRWLGRGNRAPVFVTVPPVVAATTRAWTYAAAATDADGHMVSWTLDGGPLGMSVDPTTGLVAWTPAAEDRGRHDVALAASDGFGGRAVQRFTLTVEDGTTNHPPVFTSIPVVQVAIGASYAYDADARDDDGDPLGFTLDAGPDGATIDPVSGLVTWPFALPGAHTLSVLVDDGRGGSARQTWVLAVGELPENPGAPQITSVPPAEAAVDDLYFYQAVGFDPDGDVLAWALDAGPAGMTLDPFTGRVTWYPASDQVGDHAVTITAADGRGGVATQAFVVSVSTEPANRPPYFATSPPLVAIAGVPWNYAARAVDPEFGLVTYELVAGPAGMAVDAPSGLVTWTPAVGDVGEVTVALRAADGAGDSGSQVFVLSVRAENHAPSIATTPSGEGVVGTTYRYDAHATDSDGDVVTYSLPLGPAGASFDGASGLLLWPVSADDEGTHDVRLVAEDAWGGRDEQSWTITVVVDTTPPTVAVVPTRAPACIGEPLRICVTASDDVGVAARTLAAEGVPLVLDGSGCALVVRETVTVVAFEGTATDPSGNTGDDAVDVTFANCNDTEKPTVEILTPAPGAVVTGPVEIVATIADNEPAALTWTVSVARVGTDDFTVIAEGTGAVADDVIATFDPTLLANDSYRVQILASDGLQTGGVEFRYGVGGDYKLGNIRITVTDLLLPVAGIPLSVSRTYDSLDTTPGDFGAGWRLGLSGAVSDDAEESTAEGLTGLLSGEAFTRTSRVYVTKPDGERVGFTFAPEQMGFPTGLWTKPVFEADEGCRDTLVAVDGPAYALDAGGRFYDFIIPYNPTTYALTTPEQLTYVISETEGLLRVEDALGNTLTVSPDGVESSLGVALVFERDDAGRITRVIEPDGVPDDGVPPVDLEYDYDALGNLVAFRDELDNETTYRYEDARYPHYLTGIEDPLSRPVLRYVFADDGRVLGVCPADGDPVTLAGCETWEHDPLGGVSTQVDANGNRTDLFYDERGNIVVERQWLDDVAYLDTVRVYDERGNLVSLTDPGDSETTWTYDGRRNKTSRTDPGGRTWRYAYDADCDHPTLECDPLGNCRERTFDDACNVVEDEDALGNVTEYRYTPRGMLVEQQDAVGGVWRFGYAPDGTLESIEDPLGATAALDFDANGDLVWLVDRAGRRFDYGYDDAHRLETITWDTAPPRVTRFTYDAADQVVAATDPDSALVFTWTATGRLESVESTALVDGAPDGPTVVVTYEYDGNGNLTAVDDSLGGRVEYDYDALDRAVAVRQLGAGVDPKSLTLGYLGTDDMVRAIRRFADQDGTAGVVDTWFDYDCGGCPTRLVGVRHRAAADDAVVHDLLLVRDAVGNVVQLTDAEGTHGYTSDGLWRLLSADHPDGGPQPDEAYTYDGVGNRLSSHRSAAYAYGYETGVGGNRLVADDAYDYAYDGAGNLLTRTERATGASVAFAWDHADRLTGLTWRDGGGAVTSQAAYTYDAVGRRIRSDVDGVVTRHAYDGWNPILLLDEAGAVVARRLYAQRVDRVIAEDRDGTTRWFLTDHVGTVRDLVADDGTVLAHYHYDTFGRSTLPAAPAVANDLGFTGRERLGGDLYHVRRRIYDAGTGRFVQEDPRGPWHYTYAENAPLLLTDPMGAMAAFEYVAMVNRWSNMCDLLSAASYGQGAASGLGAVYAGLADALQGGAVDPQAILDAVLDTLWSVVTGPIAPCGAPFPMDRN